MRRMLFGWLVLTLVCVMGAAAQSNERLTNPGMEEGDFGAYTSRRAGAFPINLPRAWNIWLAPPSGDATNRSDRTMIHAYSGLDPAPLEGASVVQINCDNATCAAALYQPVNVEAGATVQASAWAQLFTCNVPENTDTCLSSADFGAQTRIGIDPTGGNNPSNPAIIWSEWAQPHSEWQQMSVSTTATANTVTLFLYSSQGTPATRNSTFWDQASMQASGAVAPAQAAPLPTEAPAAAPEPQAEVPEPEQPEAPTPEEAAPVDERVVHIVREGETLDSIAFSYGVSRAHVMALNNIADPRIISIGQEIVIHGPASATEEAPAEDAEVPPEEATEVAVLPAVKEPIRGSGSGELRIGDPLTVPDEPVRAVVPVQNPAAVLSTVCVALFDDLNQNRVYDLGEVLLSGGTVSISNGADPIDSVQLDAEIGPHCFENLTAGVYLLTASSPEGYGLTSPPQLKVDALAGLKLDVVFGAAEGFVPLQAPPPSADLMEESQPAPSANGVEGNPLLWQVLQNSGLLVFALAFVVLVGGIGLTLALRRR